MNALRSGDAKLLGAALVNDLQPAALDLQPRLRLVLEAGLEYGALGALVSGSGPTCAFLVDSESAAVDLSVALSADGLCRAVRRATGPVSRRPGHRLSSARSVRTSWARSASASPSSMRPLGGEQVGQGGVHRLPALSVSRTSAAPSPDAPRG